jgi:hypothetical protein
MAKDDAFPYVCVLVQFDATYGRARVNRRVVSGPSRLRWRSDRTGTAKCRGWGPHDKPLIWRERAGR